MTIKKTSRRARPRLDSRGLTLSARRKLTQAALELFAERGLDGVGVREIARKAQVNVSLVSYHFGGKEGLYRSLLEEHARLMEGALSEVVRRYHALPATRESFVQEIRRLITHLVDVRLAHPGMSLILQRERLNGLPFCREIYRDILAPLAKGLASIVTSAQANGLVRPNVNPRGYFIALTEAVFGYLVVQQCHDQLIRGAYRLPRDRQKFIDFMTQLFTEGILR